MGIEFGGSLRCGVDDSSWNDLVEAVVRGGFELGEVAHRSASFKFTNSSHDGWREDVFLEISNEGEVYIVFHGGTGSQRDHFLKIFLSRISRLGMALELEEL